IHEMRDENDELPANFLHELYKWALESVGRVSLDTRLGCLSPEGTEDSQKIINSINTFFWAVPELELRMPLWRFYPTKAYRSFNKALDDFTEICMKNIILLRELLRKTGNRKLAAHIGIDLFLVGVDTQPPSTIYQLAKNPDKQQKLYEELKMVIANGRSLQSDAVINNYHIPKGTHVIFPHLVVSNDPTYFPEPKMFLPERWLKQNVEYNHGELVYKVNSTYIPKSPLNFKLTLRQD
ncbi:hypothetical protein DOY81_011256, partial [Sarcophaga bullata]